MIAFAYFAHCASLRLSRNQSVTVNRKRRIGGSIACSWQSQFCGRPLPSRNPISRENNEPNFVTRASLTGGGILGVGASELVVILAVGWLLLGPQKLFSLAKESGKLLGELRRTADEARNEFTDAMELDLMATEVKEGKRDGKKVKSDTSGVAENGTDPADASDIPLEPSDLSLDPDLVDTDAQGENNSAFLEQLKRVADPEQKAPQQLPDQNSEQDEELEVQRLQDQYLQARERLESRRNEQEESSSAESSPAK